MWFTDAGGRANGDLTTFGRLQFFFDGEVQPRIDQPAAKLFTGDLVGFPRPLVGNNSVSSGGNYSYVPVCFARSLKVRVAAPNLGIHYYQLEAVVAPFGTPVSEFDAAAVARLAARSAALLAAAPRPPSGPPLATTSTSLASGGQAGVTLPGGGELTFLAFTVRPFDIATLRAARLQITTDGNSVPQVDVPLADAFGDGAETRPVRATAFGMDPATSSGYFALPIPFAQGVTVRVAAGRAARVKVSAWGFSGAPSATPRLYGRHREETTSVGRDFTVLDEHGGGHLVAWVLDLLGQPLSRISQTYMEGDDRVYVDGSRSPTVYGTGTEDAFNGGFYYANGAFSLPFTGAGPLVPGGLIASTQSQYRVFGADGPAWERGVRFTMQHGGGNEAVTAAANTTFFYGQAADLTVTDSAAHGLTGLTKPAHLGAYFEGEHDGNLTVPLVPLAPLSGHLAPPPERAPDGLSAAGISFTTPVAFSVASAADNCGVDLRRLLDASTPSTLRVDVNGTLVGVWAIPETNTAKRWKEDDFEIPASVTRGRPDQRITLTPVGDQRATMYGLTTLSRTC